MKITIPKKELSTALQVVGSSVGTTGPEDIQSHFLFRPFEDRYEVLSSNGRVFSGCPFDCVKNDDDQKPFTVEGNRLRSWLSVVPDGSDITIKLKDGTVTMSVSTSKGRARFRSLDPTNFPYWDKTIDNVEETCALLASRLTRILKFSRDFVSTEESKSPQLCVAEVRDGVLWSTNKMAACVIESSALADSEVRIHVKDTSAILAFLATFEEEGAVVRLFEHDRMMVLKRDDGAVFGETRFKTAFPDLKVERDHIDLHWWGLNRDEVLYAISFLTPSAGKKDFRLSFDRISDDAVRVSMLAETGDDVYLDIACLEHGSEDGAEKISKFSIPYLSLKKVLSHMEDGPVRFGINKHPKKENSGWVSFRKESDGDKYLTILVWMK